MNEEEMNTINTGAAAFKIAQTIEDLKDLTEEVAKEYETSIEDPQSTAAVCASFYRWLIQVREDLKVVSKQMGWTNG